MNATSATWDTGDLRTADQSAERARGVAAARRRPGRPTPPDRRPANSATPRGVRDVARQEDTHTVAVLVQLLEICGDGERGFDVAARHAADGGLTRLLLALAEQRRLFAAELMVEIRRARGRADDHGTSAGALHRTWLALTGSLSGNTDAVLLREAARGERMAMHTYERARAARLPAHLHPLLERQHAAVASAHAQITAMAEQASR